MSYPAFVPLTLGDTRDDDGEITDSLVETVSAPPTPVVEPIVTPSLPDPIVPTRLLSVGQLVDPAWASPVLLLAEDVRRQHLHLTVTSPAGTATDGIVIRSDYGPTIGSAVLLHGRSLTLDNHTGTLLVMAVGAAPVRVDVWSVTK